MSDSCENCGAFKKHTPKSFRCSIIPHLFDLVDASFIPEVCKHYPIPKPPEQSEFEKKWKADDDRLCLAGDANPNLIYHAGWRAGRHQAIKEFLEKCDERREGIMHDTAVISLQKIDQIASELDAEKGKENG